MAADTEDSSQFGHTDAPQFGGAESVTDQLRNLSQGQTPY